MHFLNRGFGWLPNVAEDLDATGAFLRSPTDDQLLG
jgi:hypothetical protein